LKGLVEFKPRAWLLFAISALIVGYVLLVAVFFVYNFSDPAQDRFVSDFETADLSEWNWLGARQLCCSYSATLSNDQARTPPYSVRFELRRDDPHVRGSSRAEVRLKSVPWHTLYEVQFSTFLPADWRADDIPVTIAQWHNVNDLFMFEKYDVVPLRIAVVGDEYWVINHWDRRFLSRLPGQATTVDGYKVLAKLPVDRGRWADWRFRVRWSLGSDGLLEVWKDGKRVGQNEGPNAFNDAFTPYFKIGVYVPGWAVGKRSDVVSRVMFADRIRQIRITDQN